MTEDEVIDLLTLVAAGDRRTVGHADVEVWLGVAEDDGWTFPRARRALREHRRTSTDWVTPAHLCAHITAARKTARSKFTEDVCPPQYLADDPRAEIAWRRQRADRWTEHALDVWADTGTVPDDLPQRAEHGETMRPELGGAVARLARRFGITGAGKPQPADPNQHAEARAEAARDLNDFRGRGQRLLADADQHAAGRTP
ncbi:hypothetical protein [Alloactinosynnema sp. L-07]|uniref:hypothetical protein n=1 Tax=Alloactinosynnema sp. L-07 TaxID=1653480 RepID=UPI00065F07B8|nr:hypothetical protein [Alloactinosynnema sp. L-07]CRK59046.1 hypothetical protein [Alloactinosynnema sp. L-07]